eukprot:Skav223188  [mRNA]  locus=scaffold2044:384463:388223:+ [translate_table: standard]
MVPVEPAAPAAAQGDFRVKDSGACPKAGEASLCCSNCAAEYYCPDNKGCYSHGAPGCPGALCPVAGPIHA